MKNHVMSMPNILLTILKNAKIEIKIIYRLMLMLICKDKDYVQIDVNANSSIDSAVNVAIITQILEIKTKLVCSDLGQNMTGE